MGLLEQKLKGLLSYIDANTPRATRPVAKPSQVINQGLINPNKYNEPAASRFKDSAFGLLGVVPGVGDAASAVESADLFNRGENFAGSMAALGALPIVPALGGIFIGKGAKTWDVLKAQEAEELLAKGLDPREVWQQTGTLKGVDGALRQEIPDDAAKFGNRRGNLDHIIAGQQSDPLSVNTINSAMVHKDLNAAYPDVMDINLNVSRKGNSHYKARTGLDPEMIDLGTVDKSTMLHELQHAIQQREGWARGGSPSDFSGMQFNAQQEAQQIKRALRIQDIAKQNKVDIDTAAQMYQKDMAHPMTGAIDPLDGPTMDFARNHKAKDLKAYLKDAERDANTSPMQKYKALAGEAEARLTQSRMGLDAAQRLEHYPYDQGQFGLDVPLDSLIVRGLLGQ